MVTIKIILGSNRPGRFGNQPAEWIKNLGDAYGEKATFELVDLAEVNLPFLDESTPALMGKYEHDHTKAWAKTIGEADGFVFLSPEYNHGYSATIKNAIDYLYTEWNNKPVSFISYGAEAGGVRAMEQLRTITAHLNMFNISEHVAFPNYYFNLDEQGAFKFTEDHAKRGNAMLDKLIFWAEDMKAARTRLV